MSEAPSRLQVVNCEDMELARELFEEYLFATQEETGLPRPGDGVFEALLGELDRLPGPYQAPDGALLVARNAGEVVGSVGLARVDESRVEVRRLWVRPGARRLGVGRALTVACVDRARELKYERVVLDVVPERTGAIALYRSLGFTEIADFPFPMVFMERSL